MEGNEEGREAREVGSREREGGEGGEGGRKEGGRRYKTIEVTEEDMETAGRPGRQDLRKGGNVSS